MSDHAEQFMKLALRLAQRGRGRVEPNPVVGCVLVKGGRIVGHGYHKKFGGPHAEVEAVRDAGRAARGSTAYVTLEPCCHHGKTGPCTAALIEAGITRVVVACKDPFEQVSGRGIRTLKKAGVTVEVGLCRVQAERVNAPFFKLVRQGLPYVIAKWAATVDGAIATASGDSRWVSGGASRKIMHQLRARVDAVVVGIGTVLADDPLLTARGVPIKRVARRVVMDPQLKLPLRSKLVKSLDAAPLTVATTFACSPAKLGDLMAMGVDVVVYQPDSSGAIPPRQVLKHLAKRYGAANVLIEGGGRTLGHFFAQGLVDELWAFTGPKLLGDPAAIRPLVMPKPAKKISAATQLTLIESRVSGADVLSKYLWDAGP